MNNRTYINGFGINFGPSGYVLEEGADEATIALAEKLYSVKPSPAPVADPPPEA